MVLIIKFEFNNLIKPKWNLIDVADALGLEFHIPSKGGFI